MSRMSVSSSVPAPATLHLIRCAKKSHRSFAHRTETGKGHLLQPGTRLGDLPQRSNMPISQLVYVWPKLVKIQDADGSSKINDCMVLWN